MKKKQLVSVIGICMLISFVLITVVFLQKNKSDVESVQVSVEQMKEKFQTDIQELRNGKYANLISKEFTASVESVEAVYNLEIFSDISYKERTYLESFAVMNEAIDKFFQEDFDKSYLVADPFIPGQEIRIEVNYNDIENVFADEKYEQCNSGFLFGSVTTGGKYYVQTMPSLLNTWFSRYGFENIHPAVSCELKDVYTYISGIRQGEDAMIYLQDGEIALSEMEKRVLIYLNGENFPLPKSEGITYTIGDVRVLANDDYEGLSFKVRRNYKGVLFEYGQHHTSGIYNDTVDRDTSEIDYAVSTHPDTMLSFGKVNGTVVETEEITEMITLGTALDNLSKEIGENSIYDVYGVELIYRNCEIPEERKAELDDILEPKWKIITMNQNDNKYTLFYVDVVTGEITERFEYYYE